MKIAIVAPSPVPFLIGGAEKFWWGLHHHLNQLTPHAVELIKVPSRDTTFWGMIEAYVEFSRLDLSLFDMVISTKYPAWMVAHRNHHCYMQHSCRGLYDLYQGEENLPEHPALDRMQRLLFEGPPDRELLYPILGELFRLRDHPVAAELQQFRGPLARAVVHRLDQIGLAPTAIQRYSAISHNVAHRADYLPAGVPVTINHHPTDLVGLHSSAYRTIFTASRLTPLKRIDLLIRAFRQVDGDIEFRIAGTGDQAAELRALAAGDPRITFLGFVPDARIVEEYAQALFVPFAPYDEDYGLITVEAMQSAKAVLTCHDSGGVQELVVQGENGLSVPPEPGALAEAMQRLISDRPTTIGMGLKAQEQGAAINWPHTVSLLLGDDGPKRPTVLRPRIVVVSTYGVWPPQGGGQYRTLALSRELARDGEVLIISLGRVHEPANLTNIASGLREQRIPRTEGQHGRAVRLQQQLGVSADDIANIDDWRENEAFVAALQDALAGADLVIMAHPYLYYAVRELGYTSPLWLDAQDVAVDLKGALLPATPEGAQALRRVEEVEGECLRAAEHILPCSDRDGHRFVERYGVAPATIIVVANGVDVSQVHPPAPAARRLHRQQLGLGNIPVLLCMASWHGPNVEALPLLARCAQALPSGCILLTGTLCAHPAARELPDNILRLGVLDEEAKGMVLGCADLALNLVTSGSGTNVKMLEYAAWGLPIITTPFGNRGLDFIADEHIIVAEPEELPSRAADLAACSQTLAPLAARARALVRLRYDWPGIVAPLRVLLKDGRQRRPSTPSFR